jgi:hypothetical protein
MRFAHYIAAACILVPTLVASEDSSLTRAVRLIDEGRLDEAESILREVDRSDGNYWIVQYGLPPHHWIAAEYLEVIRRRREGDRSDTLFRSNRFQFHLRRTRLTGEQAKRIAESFEHMLTRVADWAQAAEWRASYHKTIFVEIADEFPSPSPARTLIFFWDRQDRSPRMEITARVLAPELLEVILAHELTHIVLPHTCRPLAEGMANLAAKDLFPDGSLPVQRPHEKAKTTAWPLEEVLLYNVRAQGRYVREEIEETRRARETRQVSTFSRLAEAYDKGDALVDLVIERWGRERLMRFYRTTNRDPDTFDVIQTTIAELGPLSELREAWEHKTGGR